MTLYVRDGESEEGVRNGEGEELGGCVQYVCSPAGVVVGTDRKSQCEGGSVGICTRDGTVGPGALFGMCGHGGEVYKQ